MKVEDNRRLKTVMQLSRKLETSKIYWRLCDGTIDYDIAVWKMGERDLQGEKIKKFELVTNN